VGVGSGGSNVGSSGAAETVVRILDDEDAVFFASVLEVVPRSTNIRLDKQGYIARALPREKKSTVGAACRGAGLGLGVNDSSREIFFLPFANDVGRNNVEDVKAAPSSTTGSTGFS